MLKLKADVLVTAIFLTAALLFFLVPRLFDGQMDEAGVVRGNREGCGCGLYRPALYEAERHLPGRGKHHLPASQTGSPDSITKGE